MHKSRFRFFVLPILLLALLLPLCTGVHGADLGVERSVFQFLTAELGLNSAAACGVLANIEAEPTSPSPPTATAAPATAVPVA